MKRSLCIFSCALLVLVVARVELDNRLHNPGPGSRVDSRQAKEFSLRNVRVNESTLEGHRLQVKSGAAVVLDTRKGEVLFEKNMERELPIASLTKLMSALVFLESNSRLDNFTTITASDANCTDQAELRMGETLTFRDLLHACLMSSSNRATRALARVSGLSPRAFVDRMNRKAKELGLKNTSFCEPTGLSAKNTSTALDCAKLLYFALEESTVACISGKVTYDFVSLDPSRSAHRARSVNSVLFNSLNVKGCKTGHNGPSGWCLGTMVEGADGKQMVAVVLGAPDKHTRYIDIQSIVEWCLRGG